MAKFSIAYYTEALDDDKVLTYENNLARTLIGDFWKDRKEKADKFAREKGRTSLMFGLKRATITDFINKTEDILRIPQNSPQREDKVYKSLPFVKDLWNINDNSFSEELWYTSEFLADVLKSSCKLFIVEGIKSGLENKFKD